MGFGIKDFIIRQCRHKETFGKQSVATTRISAKERIVAKENFATWFRSKVSCRKEKISNLVRDFGT